MPEGDTVHKLANAMRPRLEGAVLEGLWLRDRGWLPLAGEAVLEVAPLGKHLLVVIGPACDVARQWVLHVHLGMHGRWRRMREGSADGLAPGRAVVRIDVGGESLVCLRAARAEMLRRVDVAGHPALSRLGPDLLAPAPDFAEILRRARLREARSVAELLLDQRVACGIGNVYKSEVLFLERVHPRTHTAELSDAVLEGLYQRARELMSWNLGGWRRTTLRRVSDWRATPRAARDRSWVYDRAGEPCRRCRTRVRVARVGDEARPTWWCPGCQPAPRREAEAATAQGAGAIGRSRNAG